MGDVHMTIRVTGAADPATAARTIAMLVKRSLYLVSGIPGEFGALIEAPEQDLRIEVGQGGETGAPH